MRTVTDLLFLMMSTRVWYTLRVAVFVGACLCLCVFGFVNTVTWYTVCEAVFVGTYVCAYVFGDLSIQ